MHYPANMQLDLARPKAKIRLTVAPQGAFFFAAAGGRHDAGSDPSFNTGWTDMQTGPVIGLRPAGPAAVACYFMSPRKAMKKTLMLMRT